MALSGTHRLHGIVVVEGRGAADDEDYLAVALMGVESRRRTRAQRGIHYLCLVIDEVACVKASLSSLEAIDVGFGNFFEVYNHNAIKIKKKPDTPMGYDRLLAVIKYCFCLERVLQSYLSTPAAVDVAVVAVGISAGELVYAVAAVGYRAVVDAESVAIGMAPVLVQEVADVEDVERELNGVDLSSYLEGELLSEVDVEVLLEGEVVGIALVVLSAVLAEIGVAINPCLHELALHGCREGLRICVAVGGPGVGARSEEAASKGVVVERRLLELHGVDLVARRYVEQVVAVGTVAVHVAVIIECVR